HGQATLPLFSTRNFRQALVQGWNEADGVETGATENCFNRVEFRQHAAVGSRILPGEFSEFCCGALQVAPLGEVRAIPKHHVEDGIGRYVLQAVVAQVKFVVLEQRIGLDATVGGGADVVVKTAQSELGGLDAPAYQRPAFEHQATVARLSQVGGGNQAVVAGASHNDIEAFGGSALGMQGKRAERQRRQGRAFHKTAPGNGAHAHASWSNRRNSVPVSRASYHKAVRPPYNLTRPPSPALP